MKLCILRARTSQASGCALLSLMCLGSAKTVWAQDPPPPPQPPTREADAVAARRTKSTDLTPNEPGKVESAFKYIEETRLMARLFNPTSGWFIKAGGMTEGNGIGLGGGYRLPVAEGRVDFGGTASFSRSVVGQIAWTSDAGADDLVSFNAQVAFRRDALQYFFGLGPDTNDALRSAYSLRSTNVSGGTTVRMTKWLSAQGGVGFLAAAVRNAAKPIAPMTITLFARDGIPALVDPPDMVIVQGGVVADWRDALNARSGGRYAISYARHQDRNGTGHDFGATTVDLQTFVPMWNKTRVFAIRVLGVQTEARDGHTVPFYLQPTLGGSRSLRGFVRQRFRDQAMAMLQAEYRYEVNPFVMGALFVDAGQVGRSWKPMNRQNMQYDYGIGLRVGYTGGVGLRADLAFGGEGPRLIIAMSGVF